MRAQRLGRIGPRQSGHDRPRCFLTSKQLSCWNLELLHYYMCTRYTTYLSCTDACCFHCVLTVLPAPVHNLTVLVRPDNLNARVAEDRTPSVCLNSLTLQHHPQHPFLLQRCVKEKRHANAAPAATSAPLSTPLPTTFTLSNHTRYATPKAPCSILPHTHPPSKPHQPAGGQAPSLSQLPVRLPPLPASHPSAKACLHATTPGSLPRAPAAVELPAAAVALRLPAVLRAAALHRPQVLELLLHTLRLALHLCHLGVILCSFCATGAPQVV